jgi:hypothetical protein
MFGRTRFLKRQEPCRLRLEELESRLAPATITPSMATYKDVDGDAVTVRITHGNFSASNFQFVASGAGEFLQTINLQGDPAFQGAKLTISVKRTPPNGDGLVNVGGINASGIDLGMVSVQGDLGFILAGDSNLATTGLSSLTVHSLGRTLDLTQAPETTVTSVIQGKLGKLMVQTDMINASVEVLVQLASPMVHDAVGSVMIGGSLIGSSASLSGMIAANGSIDAVMIGGDVQGGNGPGSGVISAPVIKGVAIGGSLVGGVGDSSGTILSSVSTGKVSIAGDLIAGTGGDAGGIGSNRDIAGVSIGGTIRGGTIRAGGKLGPVTIKGSIIGTNPKPVVLSAATSIASLTVGRRVEFVNVLGGYDINGNAVNGSAQIGAVMVGGDWIASNLVSGAVAGPDGLFGTSDDIGIAAGSTSTPAAIASIRIQGDVLGTFSTVNSTDHYGFVAQQIDSLSIAGAAFALKKGPSSNAFDIGDTGDVSLREV